MTKQSSIADLQSKNPADCRSEFCSIHKFINETIDAIIDPGAKNNNISEDIGFANRQAWKTAQNSNQACSVAKQLLTSVKPPPKATGKNTGEYWNDVRTYCREATIAKDGLLVVKNKPELLSGNVLRERIVVPKPLVPALLYHLHNHRDQHPVKSQQKSSFQRQFFAIHLDKHLDLLYKNCYKCAIVQKLPKQFIQNETKTKVDGPQTHFHADVIKRAKQNILTLKDHFSSFQDAILIPSERAEDLKEGLVILTSAMRRPGEIYVSVDNAPGFKSLLLIKDQELMKLNITLVKTDEINKNANAVVDKGCQELEEEIKQLEPEGRKITNSILKLAIRNLNSKLRRRGNISAYEINTARDQNTGENLQLEDKSLRSDQLETRKSANPTENIEPVEVGDTVMIKNQNNKHQARDMFIVTGKSPEEKKVQVQKLLHPLLLKEKGKIMSKRFKTDEKQLITIHRPEFPDSTEDDVETEIEEKQTIKLEPWNPIDERFFHEDSDDDNDDAAEENDADQINLAREGEVQHDDNEVSFDDQSNESNDLQWDDSPEQIDLQATNEEELQLALLPRNLFEDERDEVFSDFQTPLSSPAPRKHHRRLGALRIGNNQLSRQNAFRRNDRPTTEPRITRAMINSMPSSISAPTSPSQVILDRAQNLENVLRPTTPIVPEAVTVDPRVQVIPTTPRRSARNENNTTDYRHLHLYGKPL